MQLPCSYIQLWLPNISRMLRGKFHRYFAEMCKQQVVIVQTVQGILESEKFWILTNSVSTISKAWGFVGFQSHQFLHFVSVTNVTFFELCIYSRPPPFLGVLYFKAVEYNFSATISQEIILLLSVKDHIALCKKKDTWISKEILTNCLCILHCCPFLHQYLGSPL